MFQVVLISLGLLAYVAEAAKMLPRNKAQVRIRRQWCVLKRPASGTVADQPRFLVLKVSPDAKLDDGNYLDYRKNC